MAQEGGDGLVGKRALENLCRIYWLPLYGYVRRKGFQPADAEDLTQGFFAKLLEKQGLSNVGREKGKFRTLLLTCLDNHLHDERLKRSTKKRGGDRTILSLDWEDAESQYRLDPPDEKTPEHYFDYQWALQLLERALARLQESYETSDKATLFRHLKPYLTGNAERGQFSEIAEM